MSPSAFLDVSNTSFFLSLGSITFNPTAWNIVARNGKQEPSRRSLLPSSETSLTTLKNTTTRQSPAFSVATLVWVVTSLPYAFSVREYYGITCPLTPRFSFLSPPFPSRSAFKASNLRHSSASSQILERTTRTTSCAHPPRSARYLHPRRAFRSRADIRRDVDLGTWHHEHVPVRLFRHSDGSPCRGLHLQCTS